MRAACLSAVAAALCLLPGARGWCAPLDLTHATIVAPADRDSREQAALSLLLDESARRTGIRWKVASNEAGCLPCILIGRAGQMHDPGLAAWPAQDRRAEAYRITLAQNRLRIEGFDDRGVLYGVGYLLRHMQFAQGHAVLAASLPVVTAPQFALRGHQLGYRAKNNTYDAWNPAQFEQYIRDLAVFGANTIELLPPKTDDAPSSPLFPLPAMEMMEKVSAILQKYGLRCSVYYPAMAANYADPSTVSRELSAWGDVLRRLPQVDELFVPGGDPGHTDPAVLFPFLAKVAQVLHQSHPGAGIWVSAQGFDAAAMQRFYALVSQRPPWLTGVVVGPQSRDGVFAQRAHLPPGMPIRFYPDIAHTREAQFSVPEWDPVFALTEGREVIDPRPLAETTIFRHYAPAIGGFVTYSEGVNDDVNKFVWTALGWSATADPVETLHEYARYFLGSDGVRPGEFARGVLELEQNWNGAITANSGIDSTLRAFQKMRMQATTAQAGNWRFAEAMYRAETDAYERSRALAAAARDREALDALGMAKQRGSAAAMQSATLCMQPAPWQTARLAPLKTDIDALAAQLFYGIGLQLSVRLYGASGTDRGASLDTLDVPLDNAQWLAHQFEAIRALPAEPGRLAALQRIVQWDRPGAGSFYDDLGLPAREPHLVRGPGYPTDPAFRHTALDSISDYTPAQGWKLSEICNAGALYDNALRLRYTGLDHRASYTLRIDYAGEPYTLPMTLVANGRWVLQKDFRRVHDPQFVDVDIPREATAGGTLDLSWTRPAQMGGGGRGLQVAEVWLLRTSR